MISFRSPFCRVRASALFLVSVTSGALPGFSAEEKSADRIVELPAMVVTDSRELPPPESWRYAAIPGFEILSNAPESETQKLLRDFQLFNIAIDTVWKGLQEKRTVPIALIICGKGGKFDAFLPPNDGRIDGARASLFFQNREQVAIVLDFEAKTLLVDSLALREAATQAAPNAVAAAEEADPSDPAAAGGQVEVDHYSQLYREYIRYLMSRIQPRQPAWFEEGLSQLFMGMKFDRRSIVFAKVTEPGETGEVNFNQTLQGRAFIPLQDFFDVQRDSNIATSPIANQWSKQAQAFVHLCLYGEGQKYQKSFLTFLLRIQTEPVTEALFKECFKMSYKNMLTVLAGYRDFTVSKSFEWRLPKGQMLPEPTPLALREATQSEVGRIKGDALRLAGRPEAAHAALVAPYIRGERDPRLLAALGLEELAAGRTDRAEKFLEAAVTAKVDRPRAGLELARLRYKAHLAQPAAAEGQFSDAQTQEVIAPLLAVRSQPPPLPEIYELLGDTLVRSVTPPARETLAVLYEGVNLFPGRLGIAYQTAVLSIRSGHVKGAAGVIEHGLRLARDEKTRALFSDLKASLPPVPASSAPAAPPAKAKR